MGHPIVQQTHRHGLGNTTKLPSQHQVTTLPVGMTRWRLCKTTFDKTCYDPLIHQLQVSTGCGFCKTSVKYVGTSPFVPTVNGHSRKPKLEVPTIYKALCKAYVREYSPKIWPYMVLTYLHFRILKFPLIQESLQYLAKDRGQVATTMVLQAPLQDCSCCDQSAQMVEELASLQPPSTHSRSKV